MHANRDSAADIVPVHSLYGEPTTQVVDFLHIERLRSRSELFDWTIDPHIHQGLVQVMLLFGGGARVALDDARYVLRAPVAITTPPAVIHSFEIDPGSSGFVVTLPDGHLGSFAMGPWIRERLFGGGTAIPLATESDLVDRLHALCEELLHQHETLDTGRVPVMDAVAQVILVLLAREVDHVAGSPGRQLHARFREFLVAVEDHYTEHWPLDRYADLLHLSESSLNRVCRSAVGSTAFELVQGRLELEARRRLVYTTVPIHRLAMDLGFVDASYFSRFFKRRIGTTPSEFRRNHQAS